VTHSIDLGSICDFYLSILHMNFKQNSREIQFLSVLCGVDFSLQSVSIEANGVSKQLTFHLEYIGLFFFLLEQ
jgi:hypothetical protein